jgi:DNA-binding transcriptional regulator GbsR (MarR family)
MDPNKKSERLLLEVEKDLVEILVEMGANKGQNSSISMIIAYLLIYRTITQKKLKKLTGLSLGTISTVLSSLSSTGFVKKELKKGTHTFNYTIGDNMPQIASNVGLIKQDINEEAKRFFKKEIAKLESLNYTNNKRWILLKERLKHLVNLIKIRERILKKLLESDFFQKIVKNSNR